jgi:hypothetical protein
VLWYRIDLLIVRLIRPNGFEVGLGLVFVRGGEKCEAEYEAGGEEEEQEAEK